VALDFTTGDAGTTKDELTKRDAVRKAMDICSGGGSTHCETILTYNNGCGAVAAGTGKTGLATAPTIEEAEAHALAICARSGTGCHVVHSACSYAVRVR
jgi:hypothetical protein